jgi:hypothetical protein
MDLMVMLVEESFLLTDGYNLQSTRLLLLLAICPYFFPYLCTMHFRQLANCKSIDMAKEYGQV